MVPQGAMKYSPAPHREWIKQRPNKLEYLSYSMWPNIGVYIVHFDHPPPPHLWDIFLSKTYEVAVVGAKRKFTVYNSKRFNFRAFLLVFLFSKQYISMQFAPFFVSSLSFSPPKFVPSGHSHHHRILHNILGDPEATANLYCNFSYPYLEGCVIWSIYICGNFWVTQ